MMYLHVSVSQFITLIYIPCYLGLPYHPPPPPPQVEVSYHHPQTKQHTSFNSASNSVQLENNGAFKSVQNPVQSKHITDYKPGQDSQGSADPPHVNVPDSYLRYSGEDVPTSDTRTHGSNGGNLYNYFKNVYKSKGRENIRKLPDTSTNTDSEFSIVNNVENDNPHPPITSSDHTQTNVLESVLDESKSTPDITAPGSDRANSPENIVLGEQYSDGNHRGINVRLLDGTQLAMRADGGAGEHSEVSDLLLSVGTSLAALFTLGLVLGIFSCCCRRGKRGEVTQNGQEEKNKVLPQVDSAAIINQSELPNADEDQDESLSVKDKIRALDKQLILQPSPAHRPSPDTRKKSRETSSEDTGQSRAPQIVISDDFAQRTSSNVGSRENVSRSDTQDDVSEITMDNESMHSSVLSQPYNPDVVIADEGEPDEFGDIQRGTVILKSFQRVKPPRNRSPATRHSKGRIRKSRPILDPNANKTINDKSDTGKPPSSPAHIRKPPNSPADKRKPPNSPADKRKPPNSPADKRKPPNSPADKRKPPNSPADKRKPPNSPADIRKPHQSPAGIRKPSQLDDTRKPQHEPEHAWKPELSLTPLRKPGETNEKVKMRQQSSRRSRPLSASIPMILGSLADKVKTRSHENLCDNPNDTQSIFSDLKDLNAIKNKLAAIQSQQDNQPELPYKYKKKSDISDNKPTIKASEIPSLYKTKEPTKSDDNVKESPSLYMYTKSGDSPKHRHSENEPDPTPDSPTRYKKHKGSPAVNKRKLRKHEGESSSLPRTDTRGDDHDNSMDPGREADQGRLSAIPPGAQNNIFYLIDPTVKHKCQSAGELVARQNAQHTQKSEDTTASKHRGMGKDYTSGAPVERERISRNSQILEQTDL